MFQSFVSSLVALMLHGKHNMAIKDFFAHNSNNGRLQNGDHNSF